MGEIDGFSEKAGIFQRKQFGERLVVADNLRKGAATTAVQIAELLVGNL